MILQITLALLVVSTIWFVWGLYFQQVIRPFIHDCARFGVFAVRDELRAAAIRGEVDKDTFAYGYLESMLNNMVHTCAWFSFSVLIEYAISKGSLEKSPEMRRFDRDAGQSLKRMERTALRKTSVCLLANSLGWFLVGLVIYGISRLRHAALRYLEARSRHFWHDDQAMAIHAG